MVILLILIFLIGLVELLIYRLPSHSFRKVLAIIIATLTLGLSFGLLLIDFVPWTVLIGFFSLFRAINLLRLVDDRKQIDYLRVVFLRSSRSLLSYQVVVVLLAYIANVLNLSYHTKGLALIIIQLVAAVVIFLSLNRSLKKTSPLSTSDHIADHDLPDVTVAIPARNETTDLEDCLAGLVKSNYPKLEILVLDDCSQNKQTPEIIKQFAHDGVRFLAGEVPSESWSAKNYAYQQLTEQSSGKLILFCGVDIRFSPDTIRQMVELMLAKRKTMLSFIPNNDSGGLGLVKLLAIQPWRYLWELGLPRRSLNRPPVLSSCWLIDRTSLLGAGGFKAVSRDVIPERYFARESIKHSDGYSFVQSGDQLGLSSHKSFGEQYSTAIRTRYPVLKQRLELVSLVSLAELAVLVIPIILLIIELARRNWLLAIISGLNFLIVGYCFLRVAKLTYRKIVPLSLVAVPFLAIYDISLLLYSMWQYEFNEVVWKGRNVCIPVMHTIPSLPAIEYLDK